MPIDTSIYDAYIKPPQPLESASNAMAKASVIQESRQKAQDAMRSAQEDAQIRQVFQKYGPDMDGALKEINTINPIKAAKMQETWDQSRKAHADLQNSQIDHLKKVNEYAGQALALYDPKDPSSWGHAQAALTATYMAGNVPLPDEYKGPPPDQATLDRWKLSKLSVDKQFDAAKKNYQSKDIVQNGKAVAATFDPSTGEYSSGGQPITGEITSAKAIDDARQAATAAETARHNRSEEAISAGNLGIRQKELGLQIQKRADELAKGTAGVKLPAATAQVVAGLEQSESIINELQGIKGKEAWLGPIAGRMTEAKISTPFVDVPDDMAKFVAQTATLKNSVIKAITGAQMSEPEAARIMQQIPLLTDKPNVWLQKAQETKKNAVAMRKRILALSGGPADDGQTETETPVAAPKAGAAQRFKIISVK